VKNIVIGLVAASAPLSALAQTEAANPRWLTALITWAPFLFLIVLWIFFLRRMKWFGKGGYQSYMSVSQEKLILIEGHLADIAASLRKIAEKERRE
jgi:ATP-dependent Zn protease